MSLAKKRSLRRVLLAPVGTGCGIVLMLALKPSRPCAGCPGAGGTPSDVGHHLCPTQPVRRADDVGHDEGEPVDDPQGVTLQDCELEPHLDVRLVLRPVLQLVGVDHAELHRGHGLDEVRSGPGQDHDLRRPDHRGVGTEVTTETAKSEMFSAEAIPVLSRETLQTQSGNIDTVSGATYTSEGYRQSLQSALDAAAL